ncbi:hypothetical protein [Streptomyces sp. NPDC101234]|uniref:hypothetical protein n=1 Tax=Streptomyces sp. NPDC101234 TaxID=3366138 RepID=UPI0038170F78
MSRPTASARRERVVLTGYFLGLGVMMAVWGARMPAVQLAAQLSTARLSLVLLAAALGMVAGLRSRIPIDHEDGSDRTGSLDG